MAFCAMAALVALVAFVALVAVPAVVALFASTAVPARSALLAVGTFPSLLRLTCLPVIVWLRKRFPDNECLAISLSPLTSAVAATAALDVATMSAAIATS